MSAIRVGVSRIVRDIITIEIPDGLTEEEAVKRTNAAIEDEWDDWEWQDDPVFAVPPDLPGEPPAGCWIELDGHEWASNGFVMVRRDGPRPSSVPAKGPWFDTEKLHRVRVVSLLRFGEFSADRCVGNAYEGRLAPVLTAGKVEARSDGITRVLVEGEPVAFLMPKRAAGPGESLCDHMGREVSP